MALIVFLQFAGLLCVCSVAAFATLWIFARFSRPTENLPTGFMHPSPPTMSFLFAGDHLVDASEPARDLLGPVPVGQTDWECFQIALKADFPDLGKIRAALPDNKEQNVASPTGSGRLTAQWRNGLVRVVLERDEPSGDKIGVAADQLAAMEREIETLRTTADAAPFLVWRQTADGAINWANNAYLDMARRSDPDAAVQSWPPAKIFVPAQLKNMDGLPQSQRLTVHLPGETDPRWFECTETPIGDEILFTAVSADKTVQSEQALRAFMQTLTKTFAHLKTGLAIFDKQRRLALFNPALTDLTSLPPDFLSGRPTLHAFLDRLRDKRMIPEQRDYKSWRQQISELEDAAQNGTYEDIWSLASGQTYRISGHPHPDGALAFLMEDISAEISLTRRFRMQLETGQSVLDSFDEAIAVFSPSGALTLSNEQYTRLWAVDPSETIVDCDIIAATKLWSGSCAPTPVWGDAREFISAVGGRAEWLADVRLLDGRNLVCRFTPITGGSTLVGFSQQQATVSQISAPPTAPKALTFDKATV
ncbi:MAG: PAS-domain containing protein [Marinosulfonomonas sp.]|nr:PAS-domain containing protein [Marinosulfonomonas sp.]